jgi:hypothetical protein
MATGKKVSKLGAKYGERGDAAVAASANEETTYGYIRLPGGIVKGIAQLQQCYFKEFEEGDNKGEYFFRATGVVLEPTGTIPTDSGPMSVAGLTTSIMIPVCDAKRYGKDMTLEENVAEIQLHMRRLGGPEFTKDRESIDDLEELAAELEQMGPVFNFSTKTAVANRDIPAAGGRPALKKGDRMDIVNEHWHGNQGLEDYVPPDETTTKVKGKGAEEVPVGKARSEEVKEPSTNGKDKHEPLKNGKEVVMNKSKPVPKKPAPEPEPEPEPEPNDDQPDLDALALDADSESDTAGASGEQLIELGKEAGLKEVWMRKKAESFEEIAAAIRDEWEKNEAAATEAEPDPEPEPEPDVPTEPSVGDEVGYAPTDPRTKKPGKVVTCTVTKVNTRTETVDLKAGKAVYKDIEWSELEQPEPVE